MKHIILNTAVFIGMIVFVSACTNTNTQKANFETNDSIINNINTIDTNTIFVYYFHGSIRCNTCISVDENTHEYLKQLFAKKMKDGEIIFKSINIDKGGSPELIKKYEIYGQTLLFIKNHKVIDETDDAFQYITVNPEKWKKIIEDKINDLLN